jgi:hypothetical protein
VWWLIPQPASRATEARARAPARRVSFMMSSSGVAAAFGW